jgi:hypothetical protein
VPEHRKCGGGRRQGIVGGDGEGAGESVCSERPPHTVLIAKGDVGNNNKSDEGNGRKSGVACATAAMWEDRTTTRCLACFHH